MIRLACALALLPLASAVNPPSFAQAEAPQSSQQSPAAKVAIPRLGLAVRESVFVNDDPVAGSPAAIAGFRASDLVLALDGKAVAGVEPFLASLGSLPPRAQARFRVLRGGAPVLLTATLDAWGDASKAQGRLGLAVRQGVLAERVLPESGAGQAGMRKGDSLVIVSRRSPESAQGLADQMAKLPQDAEVLLAFEHMGKQHGARISVAGKGVAVPLDIVMGDAYGLRPASSLNEEARRDAASAAKLQGQEVEVVGALSSTVSQDGRVTAILRNSDLQNPRAGDILFVTFPAGPLADQFRALSLKPDSAIRVRAVVREATVKQQEVTTYNDYGSAALDRRPGDPIQATKTQTTAQVILTASALLPYNPPK